MLKLGRPIATLLFAVMLNANAQTAQNVVDIPTRPGATQRLIVLMPPTPKAAVLAVAVIAWLRETTKVSVWPVRTSRGTQSAAYIATELSGPEGPRSSMSQALSCVHVER